jgi:hypothetical protein
MSTSFPIDSIQGLDVLGGAVALSGQPQRAGGTAGAMRDFEALFLETLMRHAGLAEALDADEGSGGSVAGELFVREIARSLASQVDLGLSRYVTAAGES